MLPQQHHLIHLATLEAQRANLTPRQGQHLSSMIADRMEIFTGISNNPRRDSNISTCVVPTANHNEESNTTTNPSLDPLEVFYSITDGILVIGALIFVISLFVTFSIVCLAISQITDITHKNNTLPRPPGNPYNEIELQL